MANLPEFRRRRRLDDVLTTWRMPIRFARENFTSGRRRRPISLSMLKVPNVHEKNCEIALKSHWQRGNARKPRAKSVYSNAANIITRAVKTTFFSMFWKFTSRRNGLNSSWNCSIGIGVTFDETQSPFARANCRQSLAVEVECYIAVGEGIH